MKDTLFHAGLSIQDIREDQSMVSKTIPSGKIIFLLGVVTE
jgi:hypothetical protein